MLWRKSSTRGWNSGPSTGPGWEKLLWECSEQIEKELQSVRYLFPVEALPRVVQVKEKFGTLRFYIGDGKGRLPEEVMNNINNIISKAEGKSANTCESCGEPGESRSGGWVKTLCDSCHVKRDR
jgi:hypothetical protein